MGRCVAHRAASISSGAMARRLGPRAWVRVGKSRTDNSPDLPLLEVGVSGRKRPGRMRGLRDALMLEDEIWRCAPALPFRRPSEPYRTAVGIAAPIYAPQGRRGNAILPPNGLIPPPTPALSALPYGKNGKLRSYIGDAYACAGMYLHIYCCI